MSKIILLQTVQFSIGIVFFVNIQLNVRTALFQTIQFSISTQFKCQEQFYFKQFNRAFVHSLDVKNSSISNNSV